jgi:hypothetical protein
LQLLPELLRKALASLALALGFAALARRPGSRRTVLQEWHGTWGDWQWRLEQRRAERRGGTSDEEYIRQLLSREEPEP